MSIFHTIVPINPLVPQVQPSIAGLSAAQLASYAGVGRALHTAGIHPRRLDFGSWQSMPPASWETHSPTESDLAMVGLSLDMGANWYAFVIPDAVALRDLAPEGTPALDDNYLTDGNYRYVVLAHGLDPDNDLSTGMDGGQDDPINLSFEILKGDVLVSPSTGISFVGEGSYSRWITRYSSMDGWQVKTAKPTAADVRAAMEDDDPLFDFFEWTGAAGSPKLKALDDRIAAIVIRRADLREGFWDDLQASAEAPLVTISPNRVTVFMKLPRIAIGAPHGWRIDGLPASFRRPNGDPLAISEARAMGQRLVMNDVPETAGVYLYGEAGRPVELQDLGVDAKGQWVFGWPTLPAES